MDDQIIRLGKILNGKLPNGKETEKYDLYAASVTAARNLLSDGIISRLEYHPPDEPRETHIMNVWFNDGDDLDGNETIRTFLEMLSNFDYIAFEIENNQIMLGCMIEDIYLPNRN